MRKQVRLNSPSSKETSMKKHYIISKSEYYTLIVVQDNNKDFLRALLIVNGSNPLHIAPVMHKDTLALLLDLYPRDRTTREFTV